MASGESWRLGRAPLFREDAKGAGDPAGTIPAVLPPLHDTCTIQGTRGVRRLGQIWGRLPPAGLPDWTTKWGVQAHALPDLLAPCIF